MEKQHAVAFLPHCTSSEVTNSQLAIHSVYHLLFQAYGVIFNGILSDK